MKRFIISKNKLKNFLNYIYAPAIVMFILLFIFSLKGVYPFGKLTIDHADMGHANAALYHHLYDALRGTKSLFFDWYTALGINMSESATINSFLSPFSLFFYFVKREYILQSLSIFTMIKMMAISTTMFVFLNKKFSVNIFWKVLFSVCFSFSGFVIQYYTNSQWLDIVAFFPLLLLSVSIIFEKNRITPYIIMLTMCLIINIYCTYMLLLFIFFIGGLYIILISPNKIRMKNIWSLVVGTISSFGLSMFIVLPAYIQMKNSARFEISQLNLFQKIIKIYDAVDFYNYQKLMMMLGTGLLIVIIIKGVWATKKDKRISLFVLGSIFFVTIQIFFENINLIWHAGSYIYFPLRFGYMISFVLICAACYYVSKNKELNEINQKENSIKKSIINKLLIVFLSISLMLCLVITINTFIVNMTRNEFYYLFPKLYITTFIVLLVVYFLFLHKRNHFINYRWISIILVTEILVGVILFIPPSSDKLRLSLGQNSKFIYTTNQIKKQFDILPSQLDRIKNIGNTLNANYPFILEYAALSNWTHTVTSNELNNFKNMGYSTHFTRLLDSGGTVFSDALINVKNTLATYDLDENLYTLIEKNALYRLYKNKYTLPFGLTVSSKSTSLKNRFENYFQYQNDLFEFISGEKHLINYAIKNGVIDDNIITKTTNKFTQQNCELEYTMNIKGNQMLYFYSNKKVSGLKFYIQDKIVFIPSIGEETNIQYPAALFNSNMVPLGSFKDQIIKFKVVYPTSVSLNKIEVGLLDLNKLGAFTKSLEGYNPNVKSTNNSVTLTVNGTAEKNMLFLPISYDQGWNCTINGQKEPIYRVANTFIGVRIQNGENRVELTFIPKGFKIGILISLSTLILLIIFLFIKRKTKLKLHKSIYRISEIAFYLIWGIAVCFVYIFPIFYTIVRKLLKL